MSSNPHSAFLNTFKEQLCHNCVTEVFRFQNLWYPFLKCGTRVVIFDTVKVPEVCGATATLKILSARSNFKCSNVTTRIQSLFQVEKVNGYLLRFGKH